MTLRAKDIVRDLASSWPMDETICWLCHSLAGPNPDYHEPHCAWADAVRWVRAADRRASAATSPQIPNP